MTGRLNSTHFSRQPPSVAQLHVAIVADVLLIETGGVSRSILAIARELSSLDPNRLRISVVARRRPARLGDLPFRRSFSPRVPRLPGSVFAFQRPVTLRGYDIVHYMDSRPPLDFPLGRTVTAVTQHGFAPLVLQGEMKVNRRYRLLNRALLALAPRADLTFTPSESERAELISRVNIDASTVVAIHHGVDQHRFFPPTDPAASRADARARFGIPGPYVLCVANYQRKKNPEGLVDAFARIAPEFPELSLVLVGSEKPRFLVVVERIRQLGLERRVYTLGHVDDDAGLRALYGGAEVFALPSLHESFGMPVLEAMACGTPVVASNVYSLPEICGDAAELVDPRSADEIAAGLRSVLADPARAAELRELGVKRAGLFTWRRSAERHLEAYEAAAERRQLGLQ
jgi:glycosyltransferase involved in cell wall biosynthesis